MSSREFTAREMGELLILIADGMDALRQLGSATYMQPVMRAQHCDRLDEVIATLKEEAERIGAE
jgi:hypothetical protein